MYKIFIFSHNLCTRFLGNIFYAQILISFFNSLLNTLGIFSIFPLITFLFFPEKIINNYYSQYFIDLFLLDHNKFYLFLCAVFFLMIFLSLFFNFISGLLREYFVEKCVMELKIHIYNSILKKNLNAINNIYLKSALNIETFHIAKIKTMISSYLEIISYTFLLLFICIGTIFLNKNFIYIYLTLLFFFLFYKGITKKIIKTNSFSLSLLNEYFNTTFYKIFFGFREIKLFNQQNKILDHFRDYYKKWINISLKNLFYISSSRVILDFLIYIALLVVFIFYPNFFRDPIYYPFLSVLLISLYRLLPIANLLSKNINYIFSQYSSYVEIEKFMFFNRNYSNSKLKFNKKKIYNFKKSINVDNVEFSYEPNKKFRFNFSIKCGEKVLIYGKSGSGKTTLFNLLGGFFSPEKGNILIDNCSIYENLKDYLSKVSYVTQESLLFEGTIFSNITFKKRLLNLNDKIKLKQIFNICGLNNIVPYSELNSKQIDFNAKTLSGGQKQRILIARCLYLKPKLLLMDESTGALDKESEKLILNKVFKYLKRSTIIMITHSIPKLNFSKKIQL
jgi:ABC-type bacteriocin/lantibiotic exporter with double-glycine peptidase domain